MRYLSIETEVLGVEEVRINEIAIAKYIQNQIQEDQIAEQISMKEYIDPFTGSPVKSSK